MIRQQQAAAKLGSLCSGASGKKHGKKKTSSSSLFERSVAKLLEHEQRLLLLLNRRITSQTHQHTRASAKRRHRNKSHRDERKQSIDF
jgi:hypothetical protein